MQALAGVLGTYDMYGTTHMKSSADLEDQRRAGGQSCDPKRVTQLRGPKIAVYQVRCALSLPPRARCYAGRVPRYGLNLVSPHGPLPLSHARIRMP